MSDWLTINWIDWFGYSASIVVLVSLTMTSMVKLRAINFIGCILFSAFAYIIGSWPTVFMNLSIACVNALLLYRLYYPKASLQILSTSINSEYFQHIISHYQHDITSTSTAEKLSHSTHAFYLLKNNHIQTLLAGRVDEHGCFEMSFNYLLPGVIQTKPTAHYLNEQATFLSLIGIRSLRVYEASPSAQAKLLKIGFKSDPVSTSYLYKRL